MTYESKYLELTPSSDEIVKLANTIPLMVSIVSLDGHFLFMNQAYADWLGIPVDQALGKHVEEIVPLASDNSITPESRMKLIAEIAASDETRHLEYTIKHPSTGENRCVSITFSAHASRQAIYCFVRDITSERQSMLNERRYKAVLDTAGEGVVVMTKDGTITSFNSAAQRLFGYTEDEIVGQNAGVLMPANIKSIHHMFVQRYMEAGGIGLVNAHRTIEGNCVRKDGTEFPADLGVGKFEVNDIVYFTAIIRDVSERKAHEKAEADWKAGLEEEVRKRGRALDRIFNMSDDILGTINFDGYFSSISPSVERIVGLPPVEALKEPFLNFVHPNDREDVMRVYMTAMQGVPVSSYELRVCHRKTNATHWTQWSVQPDLEQKALYVVGRDITDERQREEQLHQSQKMEAIGQLTGGIAHDFNNLLMAISGCLDIIDRKLSDESRAVVARYMEGAQSSAKRAASLTHRLLAFSRRQPLAPKPTDVRSLIHGMRDMIERTIGTDIEMVLQDEPDLWYASCDPNQLESGILNLMLNARDAMPNGGSAVIKMLNIHPDECAARGIPKGNYVKIAVQDTGVGMDEATRERAFDPFFTTKPIGQGTGLGLSMLYGFVHQSGGHVRIQSEKGKGATLMVYLPRTLDVPEHLPANNDKPLPIAHGDERTVLVVEDEEVVRNLITDVLSGAGYKVIARPEGNSALKVVSDAEQDIDLLVTDVGLPGLSGKQVAELTRKIRDGLPILFITGYAAGVTLRDDLLCTGNDMLLKPFTMEALLAKVAELSAPPPDKQVAA
jgi:PAS domain S-box-containing protein